MGENSIGITHNCYEALTHLRSLFGEISIWVDAICIDQTRVEEINHQVKLIGDIYRRAHTVYVWLVSNEWIYSGNLISALEELATDNTAWLERPTVKTLALRKFFDDPYWYRACTFQEFLLVRRPVLSSRRFTINRETVLLACRHINKSSQLRPDQRNFVNLIKLWSAINENSTTVFQPSAHDFVGALQKRKITNHKDQVYAYYGILETLGAQLAKLDYTKPLKEIKQTFFNDLLVWDASFLILLVDAGKQYVTGVQSWIPQWSPNQKPERNPRSVRLAEAVWESLQYSLSDPDWVPEDHNTSTSRNQSYSLVERSKTEFRPLRLNVLATIHIAIVDVVRCDAPNTVAGNGRRRRRLDLLK